MNGTSDVTLLRAWHEGDKHAGKTLLGRHFQALLRFFEHKVGVDASELIHRTFRACAETHQRIRRESSFRPHLFSVARRELHRYFRQRSARRERLDFSVTSLEDMRTAHRPIEAPVAMEHALEQLPLDDQIMFELFYAQGMDPRALGEVFEIEPRSVHARLHRARTRIELTLRGA